MRLIILTLLFLYTMLNTKCKKSSHNELPKLRSRGKAVKGLKNLSGENNLSLYYYSVLSCNNTDDESSLGELPKPRSEE